MQAKQTLNQFLKRRETLAKIHAIKRGRPLSIRAHRCTSLAYADAFAQAGLSEAQRYKLWVRRIIAEHKARGLVVRQPARKPRAEV